jgi:hypothetical protein
MLYYYILNRGLVFTRKKEPKMLTVEKKRVSADRDEHSEVLILEESQPAECSDEEFQKWADRLPEVDYPEEVVKELNEIAEKTLAQIASGELLPMTVEEFAAENGITIIRKKR